MAIKERVGVVVSDKMDKTVVVARGSTACSNRSSQPRVRSSLPDDRTVAKKNSIEQ